MSSEYLFVYGTLRRGAKSEISSLLACYGRFVDYGGVQGKLYLIDYYPGLVPSHNPKDIVRGEVYELGRQDILLPRLDDYEGCGSGFSRPTEYIRRKQVAKLERGGSVSAWAYLFNRPTDGFELVKSGDFLR